MKTTVKTKRLIISMLCFVHACACISALVFMYLMHIFPSLETFCNFPKAECIGNCVYLTQRTLHCNPTIDFPLTPSALYVWLSQFYRPWPCLEKQNKHKHFPFFLSVFTISIKFRINILPLEPELCYCWSCWNISLHQISILSQIISLITWMWSLMV